MRKGDSVAVLEDGKLCRRSDGIVTDFRASGIEIEFEIDEWHGELEWTPVCIPRWFRRRKNRGFHVYECVDSNYWFYANNPQALPESPHE